VLSAVAVVIGLTIGIVPASAGELHASASSAAAGTAGCTFDRGVTTCVWVVERTETVERVVTSGCLAGPSGVPGVRRTVFSDTYAITELTVTQSHGRHGRQIDATTTTVRTLTGSTLVSSTCEPIVAD